MSRIFEALQRSEAERPGAEVLTPDRSAAGLLRFEKRETPEADTFASAAVLCPEPSVDARLVCLTDQGSLGAGTFRVLGLRLRHLREKRKLKKIVITSTIPEEGKSFVATNLALNQARSKTLKAVLVDGDLRRPTQASRLGFSRNLPGLSEYLRDEKSLTDVVYRLQGTGLWFLPAGVAPENPIELMQAGRLTGLFDQLEQFFDWIVIETPPIFPLADTHLWMKSADGLLLVTREGVSDKKLLTQAVETLDCSTMLGVVVNSCIGNGQGYYKNYWSPAARQKIAPAIDS